MRTLVGVLGSLVALVGFASSANATATVDLLWFTAGNPNTSLSGPVAPTTSVAGMTSELITMGIYVTNTNTLLSCDGGSCGDQGGPRLQILALSIDASGALIVETATGRQHAFSGEVHQVDPPLTERLIESRRR